MSIKSWLTSGCHCWSRRVFLFETLEKRGTTRWHSTRPSHTVFSCTFPPALIYIFFLLLCYPHLSLSPCLLPPNFIFSSFPCYLSSFPPYWWCCLYVSLPLSFLHVISSPISPSLHLLCARYPSLFCPHACPFTRSLSCHLMGCCCYGNAGRTCLRSSIRKTIAVKVSLLFSFSLSVSLLLILSLSNSNVFYVNGWKPQLQKKVDDATKRKVAHLTISSWV